MARNARSSGETAKAGTILINFVLDKSGSMDMIRDATISGFNEFKNDQKREEGEAFFTLTLFDTQCEPICRAVPVREVPDLTHATYRPGGMTALYDAIGLTMRMTDDFYAANHPDQVLFVIMTDGEENASREFRRDGISQMICDRQKLAGYEFIYLGANQDSYAVGRGIGLREGRMLDFSASPEAARTTLRRASQNVSAHRRLGRSQSETFFTEAMEDLGAIDAADWQAMSEEDKRLHGGSDGS